MKTTHKLIYLWLNLLAYIAIGLGALAYPVGFAKGLNLSFLSAVAVPEFQATFGGLMLAIAAAIGLAIVRPATRHAAFFLLTLAYCGFAGGRLFGMLVHSGFDWRNGLFLLVEVLLIVWGLLCYRVSGDEQSRQGADPERAG